MRHLLAISVLLAVGFATAVIADDRRQDRSKEFTYVVPDDWKLANLPNAPHDVLVQAVGDGRSRNIEIINQTGTSPLADLKAQFERDLARRNKDFKVISSEVIGLNDKRQAIRIVHSSTTLSVPLRQTSYLLDVGGKRYVVVCTAVKEDDVKYDKVFDAFVSSLAPSDQSSSKK